MYSVLEAGVLRLKEVGIESEESCEFAESLTRSGKVRSWGLKLSPIIICHSALLRDLVSSQESRVWSLDVEFKVQIKLFCQPRIWPLPLSITASSTNRLITQSLSPTRNTPNCLPQTLTHWFSLQATKTTHQESSTVCR